MSTNTQIFYVLKRQGYGEASILEWAGRVRAASPRDALALGLDLPSIQPLDRIELAGFPEVKATKPEAAAQRRAA